MDMNRDIDPFRDNVMKNFTRSESTRHLIYEG